MYQNWSDLNPYGDLQTYLIQVCRLAYEEDGEYSPSYITAQTYRRGVIWTLDEDFAKLAIL